MGPKIRKIREYLKEKRQRIPWKRKGYVDSIIDVDGIKIIKLSGNFAIDSTPRICSSIEVLGKRGTIRGVLIDFEKVSRVDTTAFACLVSLVKNLFKGEQRIAIINLKCQERELMKILKIDPLLRAFSRKGDAMTFLKNAE